jgi:hypothetical protein
MFPPKVLAVLKVFDALPDDMLVSDAVGAAFFGVSLATFKNKRPVPRRQISEGRHANRVGDLRAVSRGKRPSLQNMKTAAP